MTLKDFKKAAIEKKVKPQMLKNLRLCDETAYMFRDLALEAVPKQNPHQFDGLQDNFTEMIREVGSLDLMEYYVKFYIYNANKFGKITPKLSYADLKWMINSVDFEKSENLLFLYICTRSLSPTDQELIYNSKSTKLLKAMCKHQNIVPEIQVKIMNDYDPRDSTTCDVIEYFVNHQKLAFREELMFFENIKMQPFKSDYVRRHGINDRVRDVMLFETWYKCRRLML